MKLRSLLGAEILIIAIYFAICIAVNAEAASEYPIGFRIHISSDVARKYAGAESQELVIDPHALFAGDSITANWHLSSGIRNAGISGETSDLIARRFAVQLAQSSPRYVHILAGTNDFRQGDTSHTIANIESMVLMARARNIPAIVGTVLPLDAAQFPVAAPQIAPFNLQLIATVKPHGAFIADYYSAMVLPSGLQNAALFSDGIHPNDAGYAVMDKVLRQTKREMWKSTKTPEQRAAWREQHPKGSR